MRLFGIVDGKIDRFDRVGWLGLPFDLAWVASVSVGPCFVELQAAYAGGAEAADEYAAGAEQLQATIP